jgi:hypothetical protein
VEERRERRREKKAGALAGWSSHKVRCSWAW